MGFIEAGADLILFGFLEFDKHLVFKLKMMTIPIYQRLIIDLQPDWSILVFPSTMNLFS